MSLSGYSWWYWQNDGEWGLALYALVSAGLLLAVSIGLRVTYAKGIAEYMDLFVWALLATSIALGCGVGGVPIHEILSPLLVLLLIVQILVSMKKGTSAARD